MAVPDHVPPRPWMQRKDSFSSLAGLEIAIPPGQKAPLSPTASIYSHYSEKALPPIPLKSPRRSSQHSYVEMEQDEISSPISKSSRKVFQLMGIQSPRRSSQHSDEISSPNSRSSRKVFQLMGVHVDTDTASKDPPRSQSRMSVSSSESGYSQDGMDEAYTAPRPARRPSSVEDLRALQKKGMFYLQAVTYSASASKIEPSKSKTVPNQLKTDPISLRHRDQLQVASPQEKSNSRNGTAKPAKPKSPQKSQTLDDMIAYERKRFEAEEFARKMWKPAIGRPELKTLNNKPRSPTPNNEKGNSTMGFPYTSASNLAPPPLVFRGKADEREEHRQSISHFSDQSDDDSPGVIASARDSVMSHIRKTVKSPTPTTTTLPITFSEKLKSPSRLILPLAAASPKRKRFSSKGKHPLRSPFPFQSSPKHTKKPQWPPPGQHNTRSTTPTYLLGKSTTPSFSKRLSAQLGRLSGTSPTSGRRSTSPIQSSVITTESREANGPDTPMPTSVSSSGNKTGIGMGFMSNITSPKFMKASGDHGEKMISPKEILEKGGMRFADAMESARKKAGVKSRAEKRRDHIRANIVKIGQADVDPDGRVNRFF